MLSWEAMGVCVLEDGLEVSEADVAKVNGSKFLLNRPDQEEWTKMDSWCAIWIQEKQTA